MSEIASFASIPAIMVICYLVQECYKWFISEEDGKIYNLKASAFLPILCGIVGMILGIITYYQNPEVIHSDNVLAAAANGIASGMASVAVRQMKSK